MRCCLYIFVRIRILFGSWHCLENEVPVVGEVCGVPVENVVTVSKSHCVSGASEANVRPSDRL